MHAYLKVLRWIDQSDARGADEIRTVGPIAQRTLENAYPGRKVPILYAPVDIQKYRYRSKGNFYLNAARHASDKNVDKVLLAFKQMPKQHLIQTGAGPDTPQMQHLVNECKNIQLLGFVDDATLARLNGKCISTISAAEGEDYSMNLIEAVASGKPTISVNLDRSVQKQVLTKTGILMPDASPASIIDAVQTLDSKHAEKMRKACERHSRLFSQEQYVKGILEALHR